MKNKETKLKKKIRQMPTNSQWEKQLQQDVNERESVIKPDVLNHAI